MKRFFTFLFLLFAMGSLFAQISIKVDDYGAVGDGTTNDRDAIQAALNDLRDNGGTLKFTSGKTYILGNGSDNCGLSLYSYSSSRDYLITTTSEDKATLKVADGTPISYGNWIFRLSNSPNIIIENLHFDGNRQTRDPESFGESPVANNYLLQVEKKCDGLRLYNLIIENGVVDNLYITADEDDKTTFMTDFEMHNCILSNAYRNNMSVIRGENFKILACEFNNALGAEPEAGIDFEPNPSDETLGYKNMLVEGCSFSNNRRFAILLTDRVSDCGNSVVKNCYFYNNGILVSSDNNLIHNNIFRRMDHAPILGSGDSEEVRDGIIYMAPTKDMYGNKIFSNYFYDNNMPEDKHLIYLMYNTGGPNDIYDNYEEGNTIDGFVLNSSRYSQNIGNNIELSRRETGYWSMDASTISGSTLSDLSYFDNDGLLQGTTTVTGVRNEALDMSSTNSYVEITTDEALDIEMNMTISVLVKWNGENSESVQTVISRGEAWKIGIHDGNKIGFYASSSAGYPYTGSWTDADISIPQSEWVHIAMTYDGRYLRMYINGEESGIKVANGEFDISGDKIYIGAESPGIDSFDGVIDEVKIYNYALSSVAVRYIYSSYSIDNISPTIISTIPVSGAVDVAIDATVSITFSEPMNKSSVSVSGITVSGTSWSGNTITLTHDVFEQGKTYTVIVNGEDEAGNQLSETEFSFTTVASNTPSADSLLVYYDGSSVNPIEDVTGNGHDINKVRDSLRRVSSGTNLGNCIDLSAEGTTYTNEDGEDLNITNTFTIMAFVNASSGHGGVFNYSGFSINTWDMGDGTVKYKCSMRVDDDSETDVWFSLSDETAVTQGEWHHVAFTYDGTDVKMYLDGQEKFTQNYSGHTVNELKNDHRIAIGYGYVGQSSAFKGQLDEAKIFNKALTALQIQEEYSKLGEEPDTDKPIVLSTIPEGGAQDVPVDATVSITFSEPMNKSTVSVSGIEVSGTSWNENILTVSHSALEKNKTYTLTVDGEDIAGNKMDTYTFSFSTVLDSDDKTPPVIMETTPANGAKDVAIDAEVSITFSEPMNKSTVSVSGIEVGGTSWEGNVLTLSHDEFANNTNYTITVNGEDEAGNSLIETSFRFTTEVIADIDKPTIIETTPADGAKDVTIDATVSITFSEAMNKSSVSVTGISVTGTSWNGNVLTLSHDEFVNNTNYTITVNGEDEASNTLTEYSFSFITENTVSGIGENKTGLLSIYPNPATDKLLIAINSTETPVSIVITDICGNKVYTLNNVVVGGEVIVNIENFTSGIYLVSVLDNNLAVLKTGRVVVE